MDIRGAWVLFIRSWPYKLVKRESLLSFACLSMEGKTVNGPGSHIGSWARVVVKGLFIDQAKVEGQAIEWIALVKLPESVDELLIVAWMSF